MNNLSGDDIVQMTQLIFAKYGFPKKIVSDVGRNFTSETFKAFLQEDEHLANYNIIIMLSK